MDLLERESQLSILRRLYEDVLAGEGRFVLLCGEAGVGKSALIRVFTESVRSHTLILQGACDPLSTPRPLGPLLDIAAATGGALWEHLNLGSAPAAIYYSALEKLTRPERPVLVVIEDVHWADQATLDFLTWIGRRAVSTNALVIVTYRSDETEIDHPLQQVIGYLSTSSAIRRMELRPLSKDTIHDLARRAGLDAARLYELTSGNPFLVMEVIAGGGELSASARDLLLARVARISPAARRVLELASVNDSKFNSCCLRALIGDDDDSLTECLSSGMIVPDGVWYRFRHELARLAVLETIPPARQETYHRILLDAACDKHDVQNFACLAHHAEGARNAEGIWQFALPAAEHASSVGSHREAAAQYLRLVRWSAGRPEWERALMLERAAQSCFLAGDYPKPIDLQSEALDIYRSLNDRNGAANCLQQLSRYLWFAGRNVEAQQAADEAIRAVRNLPPSPELASAMANRARLHMLAGNFQVAINLGLEALELCDRLGSLPVIASGVMLDIGLSRLNLGDCGGRQLMERGLDIAIEHSFDEQISRGMNNLADFHISDFNLREAESLLHRHCTMLAGREMEGITTKAIAQRGELFVERGKWKEAIGAVSEILDRPDLPGVFHFRASLTMARATSRQGDPNARCWLDRALELTSTAADLQYVAPVRLLRAEARWIDGDIDAARAELQAIAADVERHGENRARAMLNYWSWKCGDGPLVSQLWDTPYDLQRSGDWQAAHATWDELGFPFEAAMARSESMDRESLFAALHDFELLGAKPAAAMVQRTLRDLGVRSFPRGPQASTRANPAQLTSREVEVLALLTHGQHNAEIASNLFVSPKTVERHLSSIFSKLGVDNRAAAVSEAARLGLSAFFEGTPSKI